LKLPGVDLISFFGTIALAELDVPDRGASGPESQRSCRARDGKLSRTMTERAVAMIPNHVREEIAVTGEIVRASGGIT
jgi:hypothetical protein